MTYHLNQIAASAVAALAMLGGGCATMTAQPTNAVPTKAAEDIAPPESKQPPSADDGEQAMLAAVEAFLERTQEYRAAYPTPADEPDTPPSPEQSGEAATTPTRRPSPKLVEWLKTQDAAVMPGGADNDARDIAVANTQASLARGDANRPPAVPVIQAVRVVGEVPTSEPASSSPRSATNSALAMSAANVVPASERYLSELEAKAAGKADFDIEWQYRLSLLALNRDVAARDISPDLPEMSRRLLAGLIRVARDVRRAARQPGRVDAEVLSELQGLRQELAGRIDPVIETVALCRRVVTFGVYEEMAADDFVAGSPIQTIVYSEIANLQARQSDGGEFETKLAASLELFTPDGESVWSHEEPEITDLCRRRRDDFFIAQRISLPATLPAGDYVLKVRIEDKLSGRVAEARHSFTIQSSLSAGRMP